MTPDEIRKQARAYGISADPYHEVLLLALADVVEAAQKIYHDCAPSTPNQLAEAKALARLEEIKP